MLTFRKTATLAGALLLLGAGACADLEVDNPNEPDAGRALSTPGDVEALIAGSYSAWFRGQYSYDGPALALSRMAFEATAPWNNAGMVPLSRIPRTPLVNDPADPYYLNQSLTWTLSYRALAAVASGLSAIEDDPDIAAGLEGNGNNGLVRARAFAKFMQGLGHASIAALYDQGFVIDEDTDITVVTPVGYQELMTAAMGYFDEALAIAATGNFAIPANWMSRAAPKDDFVKLIHSYKARYMAAVARTPAERAAVNWQQVIAEVDQGIGNWHINLDYAANNWDGDLYQGYALLETWNQLNYFISGMADQSGRYQQWLAAPVNSRQPLLGGTTPIFIVTPDRRFARGTTLEAQNHADSAGTLWARHVPGQNWARPERGTWRWSYYRNILGDTVAYTNGGPSSLWLEHDADEQRMLKAEGLYRQGGAANMAAAAALVNVSRTAAGLNATDAAGTNTSCVPKLPAGACGNLFEMIKWEMRMGSFAVGPMGNPWYFHGRGWGDLYKGSPLHFPVPARELQVLGMPVYTFGGVGGEASSPGSSYSFPGE
jgi:hypothetical protein